MGKRLDRIIEDIRLAGGGGSYLEVFGKREAVLSGCRSLLDFDSFCIKASTDSGIVTFVGAELTVCAFRGDILCICGDIKSVDLSGGDVC